MDKNNYTVDDILADIKLQKSRRKAAESRAGALPPVQPPAAPGRREKAEPEPPAPQPERVPQREFHFSPAPPEGSTTSFEPVRPPAKPDTGARTPADEDGFEFVMPPVEKVGRGNPLSFDGHVRPLTDKAKIRRERSPRHDPTAPSEKPPASFHFDVPEKVEEPPPASRTAVIDFSSFRPPAQDVEDAIPGPAHDGRTRILPKFDLAKSQELQMEDLQRIDFAAIADQDDYYDYDEEDYHQDDTPPAVPADLSEYNSVADRVAVARDIAKVKFWLVLRCFATLAAAVALFYLTVAGKQPLPLPKLFFPEDNPRMFFAGIAGLGVLVALINSSSVGGGLISIFKMRANSDTLVSLALLATIGQSVAAAVKPDTVKPEALGLYACVAALSMLFNALGKTTMAGRIQQNFRIISSDKEKRAILPVQSQEFMREFTRDPSHRRPTIAYSAKASFFTDFLGLSYSDKYDVGIHRGMAPACLLGALLVTAFTYLLTGNTTTALAALSAILCISATFSSTFIENIPLGKLTRRLAPKGGMISGNKAVETFCDLKAVMLRESDLFPKGHVQLHGIKAYAGRVDEAILDAASVICSTDSSLAPVFLQMIGGNRKLLKKVDNIAYETGMGISAWVNSRRVLIGNRQLMQNHGISLPAGGYEQKYAEYGGEVLYLSNTGEMSAQFVVSYHIDESLAASLDHLASRNKQLIIHAVNPNITPHKIWEMYGYPEDLIDILPAELHGAYNEMTAPMDSAVAEAAYTGSAPVMVDALLACMNARSSILGATIIQMVQILLGYGIIMLIAFMNAMSAMDAPRMCAYQLFWFAAIFVVQQIRSA